MKILLFSDTHIDDYSRLNHQPKERLHSFLKVAQELVKIGEEHNITTIINGGDLLNKSTVSPIVAHVAADFMKILSSQFTSMYGIVGNHEMKLKKSGYSPEDTLVTLFSEMKFLHKEIINLGGKTFAFQNWEHELDLDWLTTEVDYYISHLPIDYYGTGFYGVDTDEFKGKFKQGLFGDIHKQIELDNLFSIGNTTQQSLSDQMDGNAVILDTETGELERIPIDPNRELFLRIQKVYDLDEEGWSEDNPMIYNQYSPKKIQKNNKQLVYEINQAVDIESMLREAVESNDLVHIYKEVVPLIDAEPVDMNFSLKDIEIVNFRSIDHAKLDLSHNYIISGMNGSGKSSFIRAMVTALRGDSRMKRFIRKGQTYCSLKITIEYQGLTYTILRGTRTGDYGLWVDGEARKYNRKSEFEKDVLDTIPVLRYMDSMYIPATTSGFLDSMNIDRKYDLLSTYYRLDIMKHHYDQAASLFGPVKKLLKSQKSDINNKMNNLLDAETRRLTTVLRLQESFDKELSAEELLEIIDEETKKAKLTVDAFDVYQNQKSKYQKIKDEHSEATSRIKKFEGKLEVFEEEYAKILKYLDEHKPKVTELESVADKLKSLNESANLAMTEFNNKLNEYKHEYQNIDHDIHIETLKIDQKNFNIQENRNLIKQKIQGRKTQIATCESSIEKLIKEKSKDTCPICKQKVSVDLDYFDEEIANRKEAITNCNEEIENFKEEGKKIDAELREDIDKINEVIEEYKNHQKEVTELGKKVKSEMDEYLKSSDYENKLNKLESEKSEIEAYNLEISYVENRQKTDALESIERTKKDIETAENLVGELTSKLLEETKLLEELQEVTSEDYQKATALINLIDRFLYHTEEVDEKKKLIQDLSEEMRNTESRYEDLDKYLDLTDSRGELFLKVIENIISELSNERFRFTTENIKTSGAVVPDLSVEYLNQGSWLQYEDLSEGQKSVCDLFFFNRVITGVGAVFFDEIFKHLDEENLSLGMELFNGIKFNNYYMSSLYPNLNLPTAQILTCELQNKVTNFI